MVETVSASVTVLNGRMADVAHTHSVEEKTTAAVKNTLILDEFSLLAVCFTTKR